MTLPRRFLPSISSLRALEALDRLGSATAAAVELSQTQSAVSRQLKTLEDQLGVGLIVRHGRGIHLTPEAADCASVAHAYGESGGGEPEPCDSANVRHALAGAAIGRVCAALPGGDDQPFNAVETF
jgi:DNA-binding transcriptional ArsR family regulator